MIEPQISETLPNRRFGVRKLLQRISQGGISYQSYLSHCHIVENSQKIIIKENLLTIYSPILNAGTERETKGGFLSNNVLIFGS